MSLDFFGSRPLIMLSISAVVIYERFIWDVQGLLRKVENEGKDDRGQFPYTSSLRFLARDIKY